MASRVKEGADSINNSDPASTRTCTIYAFLGLQANDRRPYHRPLDPANVQSGYSDNRHTLSVPLPFLAFAFLAKERTKDDECVWPDLHDSSPKQ